MKLTRNYEKIKSKYYRHFPKIIQFSLGISVLFLSKFSPNFTQIVELIWFFKKIISVMQNECVHEFEITIKSLIFYIYVLFYICFICVLPQTYLKSHYEIWIKTSWLLISSLKNSGIRVAVVNFFISSYFNDLKWNCAKTTTNIQKKVICGI